MSTRSDMLKSLRTSFSACSPKIGIRFGVGSLAHLLKNRFYIGEVTYRGEVHRGEHEPILGRDVFEAVQAKRAANAAARQVRLRGSAAILTGRLFDDRGHRMSPTHANKRGVRYRYYVSHAILQNRKAEAGNIARVPAPEIETLVCEGIRRHLAAMGDGEPAPATADRDLIERHVARVIVKPQALEVCLIPACEVLAQAEDPSFQETPLPRPFSWRVYRIVANDVSPKRKARPGRSRARRTISRHAP